MKQFEERITLKAKITEIALNEAIRGWQPPAQGQLYCPFCQSDRIYRRMQRKDGMTHMCKACEQSFSEELIQQCRCVRPGMLAKCLKCPQYQRISELMKFNIEQLRDLSETEINQIMAHPDFYQEHFSLQELLPQIKLKQYTKQQVINRSERVGPELSMPAGNPEQLSFFDS